MRHGTITLTIDLYNDLDLSDTAEQLWVLPPLLGNATTTASTTATLENGKGLAG